VIKFFLEMEIHLEVYGSFCFGIGYVHILMLEMYFVEKINIIYQFLKMLQIVRKRNRYRSIEDTCQSDTSHKINMR
jgi:hypothetical protein